LFFGHRVGGRGGDGGSVHVESLINRGDEPRNGVKIPAEGVV
jgi:hypothetical protein